MSQSRIFPKVYVVLYDDDFWEEEGILDKIFSKREDAEAYRDEGKVKYPHLIFKVEEVEVE